MTKKLSQPSRRHELACDHKVIRPNEVQISPGKTKTDEREYALSFANFYPDLVEGKDDCIRYEATILMNQEMSLWVLKYLAMFLEVKIENE